MKYFKLTVTGTKIAILSSDSSAGRTVIALNLFRIAALHGNTPLQLACFDVEKPDLIDFSGIQNVTSEIIFAPLPVIDISKCRYCGVCSGFCSERAIQFNRFIPSVTLIVSRCIGCGYCVRGCDRKGIRMLEKPVGTISQAEFNSHLLISGQLDKQSEFEIPLVKALLSRLNPESTVLCDFGPGTGSSICTGLHKMDFAAIVLQPDRLWKENLEIMLEMIRKRPVQHGVILNKVSSDPEFAKEARSFCHRFSIPLLGLIPLNPDMKSGSITETIGNLGSIDITFSEIWNRIAEFLPKNILLPNETS